MRRCTLNGIGETAQLLLVDYSCIILYNIECKFEYAEVAELVYAADLKSAAFGIGGSNPLLRTIKLVKGQQVRNCFCNLYLQITLTFNF